MIYTILGSFGSFLNWEEAIIWPQIRPRKIPEFAIKIMCQDKLSGQHSFLAHDKLLKYIVLIYGDHNGLCYLSNINKHQF